MAALTWREVSNPNFGGVSSALQTGAALQSNAFSSLGDAIQKAQLQQQKQAQATANSAVLARSLQEIDPAAYQQKLASGSFFAGVDPSTVSPDTFGSLASRASDLQSLATNQYKQDRTQSLDQIQDAARPQQAARLGLTGPLAQLPVEEQRQVLAQEGNILSTDLNNVNRGFQNRTQLRDDTANQNALDATMRAQRASTSAGDALAYVESIAEGLTPQEYATTVSNLGKTFGNLYAPPAQGGAGVKPGTQAGSPYDTTFKFQGTDTPISSMPVGQVLDVQENSKATQGHSPMGAFQINKATLEDYGPKVLGENWKQQDFSPEAQEKLAKAIFEDRKGGDLSKTWAALPNNSPGAYKNFSWDDMRQIISQGEVGQKLPSDKASLNLLTQMSQEELKRRQSQNLSVGVTADIEKNLTDTRASGEVAQDITKNQLPGADTAEVLGLVNKIQRDNPGLSAADAGSIITRSARDSSWYTGGTTSFGGGVGIDDAALERNILDYKTGQADRSSSANTMTRNQAAALEGAKEKYDNAAQNLQALQARQQIQPGISTDRAQAAFDKAEAALKRALSKQRQEPNARPVR